MFLILRVLWPSLLIVWAASSALAQTIRIENPSGAVTVEVTASETPGIQSASPDRLVTPSDTTVSEQPGLVIVKATPPDNARIDLNVKLPYGAALQVRTGAGPITAKGLFAAADLITETGEIVLEAPWSASRLSLTARKQPAEVTLPEGFRFAANEKKTETGSAWVLESRLPEMRITYGRFRVNAGETSRLTLRDIPIPEDSPVKLPWQAPQVLEALLSRQKLTEKPEHPAPDVRQRKDPDPASAAAFAPEGSALFTSSVRMVNLSVAVYGPTGRPLAGLSATDFKVLEDGVPQVVASAGADEVPFNLVLLLDLSGSTKQDREEMKAAALRFLDIARPSDRVAVYALANNRFHVVSRLTDDREQLRRLIPALPEVSGGTPLYDALALAYAEELRHRPGERNALIVISDGVDNQIYGQLTPSEVDFDKLSKAARQFEAMVYPVLLNAAEPDGKAQGWERSARRRMEQLAAATGGRLFPARSLQELEPVYTQVENELRAVYTVAYYPKAEPDGAWHSVEIQVDQPGAKVRSRDGYIAKP